MEKPYKENSVSTSIKLRHFSKDVDPSSLEWQRDAENKLIRVMGETDWKFQFDNKLPIDINEDIVIPKGIMHRLIKGTSDLNIMIEIIDLKE